MPFPLKKKKKDETPALQLLVLKEMRREEEPDEDETDEDETEDPKKRKPKSGRAKLSGKADN